MVHHVLSVQNSEIVPIQTAMILQETVCILTPQALTDSLVGRLHPLVQLLLRVIALERRNLAVLQWMMSLHLYSQTLCQRSKMQGNGGVR
jgi:hypothetical protein